MHTAQPFNLFRQVLTKLQTSGLQMVVESAARAMDARGRLESHDPALFIAFPSLPAAQSGYQASPTTRTTAPPGTSGAMTP